MWQLGYLGSSKRTTKVKGQSETSPPRLTSWGFPSSPADRGWRTAGHQHSRPRCCLRRHRRDTLKPSKMTLWAIPIKLTRRVRWDGGGASQLNRARSVLPADAIRGCEVSLCPCYEDTAVLQSRLTSCYVQKPRPITTTWKYLCILLNFTLKCNLVYYLTDLPLLSFLSGCPNFSVAQSEFEKKPSLELSET